MYSKVFIISFIFLLQYLNYNNYVSCLQDDVQYSNYLGNIKVVDFYKKEKNPTGRVFGLSPRNFLVKDFFYSGYDQPASFYAKFYGQDQKLKLKFGESYEKGQDSFRLINPPRDVHLWADKDIDAEILEAIWVNRADNQNHEYARVIKPDNFRFPKNATNNGTTTTTTTTTTTATPEPTSASTAPSTTKGTTPAPPPQGSIPSTTPRPQVTNPTPNPNLNLPHRTNDLGGENNLTGLNVKDIRIIFLPKEGSNEPPTTVHVKPGQGTGSVVSNAKLPANVVININHKGTPLSLRDQRDVNVTILVEPNPNETIIKKPLQNVDIDLTIDSTEVTDPIDRQHVNVTAHVNLLQQPANGPTLDTNLNLWIKLKNVPPPPTTTTTTTTAAPIVRPNPDVNVTFNIDPNQGAKPLPISPQNPNPNPSTPAPNPNPSASVDASVTGPAVAGSNPPPAINPAVSGGQTTGNVGTSVQGPADAGGTVTLRPQGGATVAGLEPVVQLKLCIHPAKATESALAHAESDHHVTIKSFNSDCSCSKPKNKMILIRGTAADVSAAKGLLTEWGAV